MTPGSVTDTRERIAALLEDDPTIPAREIAEKVGVSRQRVYQILSDMGLNDGGEAKREAMRKAWAEYRRPLPRHKPND